MFSVYINMVLVLSPSVTVSQCHSVTVSQAGTEVSPDLSSSDWSVCAGSSQMSARALT